MRRPRGPITDALIVAIVVVTGLVTALGWIWAFAYAGQAIAEYGSWPLVAGYAACALIFVALLSEVRND